LRIRVLGRQGVKTGDEIAVHVMRPGIFFA
jgi:hypothetical protein